MSIRLPGTERRWSVAQRGDFFGNILTTRNVHFDDRGRITLSKKPTVLYTNSDDANVDIVSAIVPSDDQYYLVSGNVFLLDPADASVTEHTTASQPTLYNGTDACNFAGRIYVSGQTTVKYTTGSSWTAGVSGLTATNPHPVCSFENLVRLAVADGNTVTLYNTSHSANTDVLTIPSQYVITGLRWYGKNLFVATRTRDGSFAKMFIWNGIGSEAQDAFSVNAEWIYSMAEYDSSMCCVTSAGQILRFNGGGFTTLANFPIYYKPLKWLTVNSANNDIRAKVFNRGMVADGDKLYIHIDGSASVNGVQPEGNYVMPSGIWCFDPEIGLYPRVSAATDKYQSIAPSSLATNVLTMASAHEADTGDAVYIADAGSLTGITVNYTYFVIKVANSTTQIKLALSPADAKAGNNISLGGSVGTASFRFDSREAISSVYDTTFPGAIQTVQSDTAFPSFFGSEMIFGARMKDTDGSTEVYTFQSLGLGRNVGNFTTVLIPSQEIEDTEQSIYIKYEGVNLETDKIVVKYRTKKRFGLPTRSRATSSGFAIWSSDKVCAIDDSDKPVRQVAVGDEVEILSGGGSGRSAHITSINEASATVREFTLDESIEGVTSAQKSEVLIDNWVKLGTITNSDTDGFKKIPIGLNAKNIEFKIELRGYNVSVEEIRLVNTISNPAS